MWGWRIFRLRPGLRLIGSFPYRMTRKTWPTRRSRVNPFHFVLCKGQKSLLISSFPIRERTILNVDVERTIRLIDRIRTKVAEDSLANSFVLLRGAIQTVVGGKFRKIRGYELHRNAAVSVHSKDACRIGAKRIESAAIRAFDVDGGEYPSSYQLVSGGLGERLQGKAQKHQRHHSGKRERTTSILGVHFLWFLFCVETLSSGLY
jgi:hypothetical protein